VLAALRARRSVGPRSLVEPGPTPEQWQLAAETALRAPDHQGLRPFRFVHVGVDERKALADVFMRAAVEQGRDTEGIAMARARAATGPGLLALVAHIRDDVPEVPPHEQWLTVGAALMNLLNALHLMGFGAKALGGSAAHTDAVRKAFCHQGEQIACWVVAGTPAAATGDRSDRAPPAPPRPRDLLLDWMPPGENT
jgi:nitroreductase